MRLTKRSTETWRAFENRQVKENGRAFRLRREKAASQYACTLSEIQVCSECEALLPRRLITKYHKETNTGMGGCVCDKCHALLVITL